MKDIFRNVFLALGVVAIFMMVLNFLSLGMLADALGSYQLPEFMFESVWEGDVQDYVLAPKGLKEWAACQALFIAELLGVVLIIGGTTAYLADKFRP